MPAATASPRDDADAPLPWLLFSFQGRIGRGTWWRWGVFAMIGLWLVIAALLTIAGVAQARAESVANLLLLWPTLALSAKRWHDRDKSAWWLLVNLVPLVGWLWALVENGGLRGSAGGNRFGRPPVARPAWA